MASIFQNGLFTEGFDGDPTAAQIFNVNAAGSGSNAQTQFGFGYSWTSNGNPGLSFGVNLTTLFAGFGLYLPTLPGTSWIVAQWYDVTNNGPNVTLRVFSDGSLRFYLGNGTGTPLGSATATGVVGLAQWVYLEAKVVIAASSGGSVALYANGAATAATTSSVTTVSGALGTYVNGLYFGSSGTTFYVDDWYMLDNTGSAPFNTFLGPVQVRGDVPNKNSAVGGRNAFTGTPATGSNTYQNVAHVPAVPASDYNADATPGDYDMFGFPNFPSNVATILAVNEKALVSLDSAGARTVALNVYSGGTDSLGAAFTPGSTPAYVNCVSTVDPNTSSAWTVANAASVELGIKVVS